MYIGEAFSTRLSTALRLLSSTALKALGASRRAVPSLIRHHSAESLNDTMLDNTRDYAKAADLGEASAYSATRRNLLDIANSLHGTG